MINYRDDLLWVSLDAGTYYLRISGYGSVYSTSNASTGKYEMYLYAIDSINDASVSKIKSRTFKYEYIKPSVKVVYKKKTLKEGVDGYEVYQSSKKTTGYKFRYRSSGYNYNAVTMYKLVKGKTYYFKVRSSLWDTGDHCKCISTSNGI